MALRYLDKLTAAEPGEVRTLHKGWTRAKGHQVGKPDPVLKPEFLIFRNITTAVVAQAASEPAYADIVTALLFSQEGQEVYLRPPASFNIPLNQPISFAQIQELARLKHQTALGYINTDNSQAEALAPAGSSSAGDNSSDKSGGGDSGGRSGQDEKRQSALGRLMPWAHSVSHMLSRAAVVHLGLSAADQVVFKENDWLVVLAEDFE